jgi:hypothetical protein
MWNVPCHTVGSVPHSSGAAHRISDFHRPIFSTAVIQSSGCSRTHAPRISRSEFHVCLPLIILHWRIVPLPRLCTRFRKTLVHVRVGKLSSFKSEAVNFVLFKFAENGNTGCKLQSYGTFWACTSVPERYIVYMDIYMYIDIYIMW